MARLFRKCAFAIVFFVSISCTEMQISNIFSSDFGADDVSHYSNLGQEYYNAESSEIECESHLTASVENSDIDQTSVFKFWNNIFEDSKCYSHIFIDDIYDNSNPIIPCESTYDLAIAKRLGFRISEANIQATATPGKYVVMHGISGTIGGQLVNLDGTSAANVVIADTSFSDLRNNYRYKSIYEEYQTSVVSLEEWLAQCKTLDMMPLVSYVDNTSLGIVKDFFGDDFILYNGPRDVHKGMIMIYNESFSREQMILLCEEYGSPLMINVASLSNFGTDAELMDTIEEIHNRNCLFGVCGCYMSGNDSLRGWRCGVDFSASSKEVNPFDDGDIYEIDSGISIDSFTTTGEIVEDTILLSTGQTISVPSCQTIPFLHASQLNVEFDGVVSISMVGAKGIDSLSSNGTRTIRWSGFALNKEPTFTITALSNTIVRFVKYQAKEM